ESRTHPDRLHNSSPPARRPGGPTARGLAPAPARRHANPRSPHFAAMARCRTPTSSPASTPFSPTQTPHTTSARLHSSPGGLLRSSQPPFGVNTLKGAYSRGPLIVSPWCCSSRLSCLSCHRSSCFRGGIESHA